MNGTKVLGVVAIVAAALIPSAAAGGNPAAALGVSPLRLELKGPSSSEITVRNPGSRPLVVTATLAGFGRTLHGKPQIKGPGGAAGWLQTKPRRMRLAPHKSGVFEVTASPPPSASAGDHPALVLLATQPPSSKKVHVLLRVGVVVLVRVSGTIVHRLVPQALWAHKSGGIRLLALRLANRGNVSERISGDRVTIALSRSGKRFATLRARRFDLLPHSTGIAQFPYGGRAHGSVVARVVLRPASIGRARSFRVTLP